MKRVGYITDKDGRRITLLEAMGDYGNVQKAYNKARKCKRHRKDVLIFTKDKEENLDKVREDIINLAYEPSKYHAKTGETTGKGVFTIVEVKAGQGASAGWGRLKSGAGWISLDYATRLA